MNGEHYFEKQVRELDTFTQNHCMFCGEEKMVEELVWAAHSISSFIDPLHRITKRQIMVAICGDCSELSLEALRQRSQVSEYELPEGISKFPKVRI